VSEKSNFSKIIVMLVVIMNVIFTVAVLYVFLQTGSEPSTLIASWFAFTVGELWLLANIKRSKISKNGGEKFE